MQLIKKKSTIKDLRIFMKEEVQQLNDFSSLIVEALSNQYEYIIDSMVGRSEATKKTYKSNVAPFLAFIQANGINAHSFGQFRMKLEELENVSLKTKNAYLTSASSLLSESLKYGIMPIDITKGVKFFKTTNGHVKDGLNDNDIQNVLLVINSIQKIKKRMKMLALFQLLAFEGLRQFEAQNIKVEDIKPNDKVIMIKGKGRSGKERVFVLQQTIDILLRYASECEIHTSYLFPSRNPKKPITTRMIRKYWTDPKTGIFALAGIPEERSTHGFRHYFTTRTLDYFNGDLNKTRMRTRHESISTVVVYDDRRLQKKDLDGMEQSFSDHTLNVTPPTPTLIEGLSAIKAMKLLRKEGNSFAKIAQRLNNEGFKPEKGKKFYPITIQRLLGQS